MKIGIFDSGIGGISVLNTILKIMPNNKYIYYADSKNAPYEIKTQKEIEKLSLNICDFLIKQNLTLCTHKCGRF